MKNSKKQKNDNKKNVTIFSSNLKRIFGLENIEICFSLFLKKLQIIEFPFKNTNLESIGILSRKLEPKYKVGAASSSNSFQNSNGDQRQIRSSSFKQVISSLSFRRKLITLKLSRHFPYKQRRPLPFSRPLIPSRELERKQKRKAVVQPLFLLWLQFSTSLLSP